MKAHTETIEVRTKGKGTYELTADVARIVQSSAIRTGTATVFVQHTSASLVIFECRSLRAGRSGKLFRKARA